MDNNYLDYIRVLRAREDSKKNKNGITTWGLLVALVYVVWELIVEYGKVRGNSEEVAYTVGLLSYMQVACLGAFIFFTTPLQRVKRGRFALRIWLLESDGYPQHWIAYLSLSLLLPLLCQLYVAGHLPLDGAGFVGIQNQINKWCISGLWLLLVGVGIYIGFAQRKSDFPLPLALVVQSERAEQTSQIFHGVVALELFAGNMWCIYLLNQTMPPDFLVPVFRCAFDGLLVVLITVVLLRTSRSDQVAVRLEALERDLVLYGLDSKAVRERIQEELLGYEAGEWLRNRISLVRDKANSVCKMAMESDALIVEIKQISSEYVLEKQGRVKNFLNKLSELAIDYADEVSKFDKWLDSVERGISVYNDPSIVSLLKEVRDQLKEVREQLAVEATKAKNNLLAALEADNQKQLGAN